MKNRHGLFIAIGLVIGITLLTVGIYCLSSPTGTDSVTYNLPASSLPQDYLSPTLTKTPYWNGYDDGYHGYSVNPPSIPSYLEYGSFEYDLAENRQEDYWKGYAEGQNERIDDIESQLDQ